MDWYSTQLGDEARRVERLAQPQGGLGGEAEREVRQDAALSAQGQERNAWEEDGGIERVILGALHLTVALAVGSAFVRAAGRRFRSPWTPSLLTAVAAAATAGLVLYRILQEPGFDEVTTVKAGAPIEVAVLGVVGLAAANSVQREQHGNEFREVSPA